MNNQKERSPVARKRFGQNFLRDPSVIQKIVQVIAPQQNEMFVEIGPGDGALTLSLLPLVKHIDAIEIDRDLVPLLQDKCKQYNNLAVHQSDALNFDFNQLYTKKLLRVVGNLPYNISTPLLFYMVKYINIIKDMHFMLQLEVVERLAAVPGTKSYGRLSVMIQYYFKVAQAFNVPPEAFSPRPKVTSSVVCLTPLVKKKIIAKDEILFAEVVRTAFNQRRKTIKNSLQKYIIGSLLISLEQFLNLRPEELSGEDFVTISNVIYDNLN